MPNDSTEGTSVTTADAQVPDEWWADEEYDQSCPTCGALIDHGKKKLHQDWHDTILSIARSYVDPPRYGGHR